MDGITIQDFSKICRFCLAQSSDELKIISDIPSTNIFKAITEVEVSPKVSSIYPIWLHYIQYGAE